MDGVELSRWTRFAAKGGIGKCTAIQDCVAEGEQDLMFLKDDEITVLMQIPDLDGVYLGYCEGVVGRFQGSDVHFHSKLKKPVMAKRSSVVQAKSPTPSLVTPTTPSPAIPPSPSRGSYTPLLAKSPSPISSSSPPPVQLYQSSRRTSVRSPSGPLTRNTYGTDEEPLDKEPSKPTGITIPLPPSQSVSSGPRGFSDGLPAKNYPGPSTSTSPILPASRSHVSPTSPPPISSSINAPAPLPSSPPNSGAVAQIPPELGRSAPKGNWPPVRMTSVDSSMDATEVPDEWVRQQVGALIAQKVEEESREGGKAAPHLRKLDVPNAQTRISRASSHLEYGTSDDESTDALQDKPRFSAASFASDDGEVGIGLSLMGALAGSDSDSDEDVDMLGRAKGTVRAGISFESDDDDEDRTVEGGVQSQATAANNEQFQTRGMSSSAGQNNTVILPEPVPVPPRSDSLRFNINTIPTKNRAGSVSTNASSPRTLPSPGRERGFDPNSPHSLDGYPSEGEEWEGASDIYDNYRYSRYSRYSRFSVASGMSFNSTKGHRQIPSTSTMPPWQAGVMGSPTSSSFPPGSSAPPMSPTAMPSTASGLSDQMKKKEELDRDDSLADPSLPSTSTSSSADVPLKPTEQPPPNPGVFGDLAGGIHVSTTTTTTVVEESNESPAQDVNFSSFFRRSHSVASTADSNYSHDSGSNYSPDVRRQQTFGLSSPARGYVTADGEESPFPSTPG
ncbi:hypothetical protein AAF712_009853 [Marasmius tenuissimus]|uniref:SH3 domain-containing protein n=1 Tax=Marasmius tenuissimus TaxID=585030 RepID=A0ABR2ZNW4_9AGAR